MTDEDESEETTEEETELRINNYWDLVNTGNNEDWHGYKCTDRVGRGNSRSK